MTSEEEKVAKILADRINERFRTAVKELEDRITHLERKLSYIELESAEKIKSMIKAIFEASVEAEVRKIANQLLSDFREGTATLKERTANLQKQIEQLDVVLDAVSFAGEKLNTAVGNLSAHMNVLVNRIENVSAVLDKELEKSVAKLGETLEKKAGEIFRMDVVIEKIVRQAVSDSVSAGFDKLHAELVEKLKFADDIALVVKQISEMLAEMKKELAEMRHAKEGLKYEAVPELEKEEKGGEEDIDLLQG